MSKTWSAVLTQWLVIGLGTVCAQDAARTPSWQVTGLLRSRLEFWDWFDPGSGAGGRDDSYAFSGNLFRIGVSHRGRRVDFSAEAAVPLVFATPKNATAPAPQGQLGLGASYRAANGDRVAFLFVRQLHVTIKGVGDSRTNLRLGRFEFAEGVESLTQDATLDWIKRERISHRLIGNFGFSHVQRTFDGVQLSRNAGGTHLSVVAARPTVGVFELNGNPDIPSVEFVYAGVTHTGAKKDYDSRLFYLYYRDGRRVLKTDNRPLAARQADSSPVSISTVGGHYARKAGRADLLAWAAWQWGSWGRQDHRAWALVGEVGYQPKLPWRPWVRAGANRTSGDPTAGDGRHETFFQGLPTPRIYARFPFFNMMNTDDRFLQVILRPAPRLTLRSDVHWLRLSRPADLWYAGGGAFQKQTFGFAGRPGGGSRSLGVLADWGADFALTPKSSLGFYLGRAGGGEVIRKIYPDGPTGYFAYWEISRRF